MAPKERPSRKLLVASVGVATMTYVALSCGNGTPPSTFGRQALDAARDVFDEAPVGNFAAVDSEPPRDASHDAMDDVIAIPDSGDG